MIGCMDVKGTNVPSRDGCSVAEHVWTTCGCVRDKVIHVCRWMSISRWDCSWLKERMD